MCSYKIEFNNSIFSPISSLGPKLYEYSVMEGGEGDKAYGSTVLSFSSPR